MVQNEDSESVIDKSTGSDSARELRIVMEFLKSTEARQVADDSMRNKMTYAAYQDLGIIRNEQWMRIKEIEDHFRGHIYRAMAQINLIYPLKIRTSKQEWLMSSQEHRLSRLERRISEKSPLKMPHRT